MTLTVLRYTMTALAALAFVSTFAGNPAPAQSHEPLHHQWIHLDGGKPESPKGLATKKQGQTNPQWARHEEGSALERPGHATK